ncbi:MAG: histone deacetylase family protein [Ardenticatenaceae bacterium]|nr:histone deacetylase family protein [Ardenticatenaceae bacterium]MCB9444844.1 histone deacetylase family protein [Ardenticatenaceae bacterium]
MHTFYYPGHIQHDPAQMHRSDTLFQNRFYGEVPQRGQLIFNALQAAKLGPITSAGDFSIDTIGEIHEYGLLNLLQNAHERMANEAESQLALPNTFSKFALRHKPQSVWGQLGCYAFDTASPIFEHTWETAYWAVQTAVSAAALVHAQGSKVAYALCRPPGHHAGPNFYGGGCYLNNTAVAAQWLVQQGQRVAILDLDYHHGNGTQMIFYGRSDALYCSIHADPLHEYPYYWGYADEYGEGSGKGYNYNFPLPRSSTEIVYLAALEEALNRIRFYVPDILIVSLGVDIIQGDPIGGFQIEAGILRQIGKAIAALRLPSVVVQEGGFNLENLGQLVVTFFNGLLGK